jgi:hypothetical protein
MLNEQIKKYNPMDIEDIKVSEAEIAEEAEAQAQLEEDEIREAVIADLGIEDNDANKDLIDKLVERETGHRTKLSKAVGQKIKYRTLAGGKTQAPGGSKKTETVDPAKLVEEKFMQRDLDEMDHSDKVKDQIKKIATMQDISIRKAEQDPYIQHMIAEEVRQKSVHDAAKGGKGHSKSGTIIDVSKPLDVSQFDLSTEEGRKEWAEAKQAKRDAAKQ